MAQRDYDNTNSGAVFPNNNKQSDRSPDYKGTLDANGTEYWVSAWVKTSRNGIDYLSISLTEKEEQQQDALTPRALSGQPTSGSGQAPQHGQEPASNQNDEEDLGPAFPSEASGMDDVPF